MDGLDLFSTWQLWLIAGTALLILEIFTPGFVLACFGIGCLGAMLASLIGLSMAWQLAAFSLISLLSLLLLRPVLMRRLEQKGINTGVYALIGRQIRLREPIAQGVDYGEITVDGDVWRARVEQGVSLSAGQLVEIVSIDGLVLTIRPID